MREQADHFRLFLFSLLETLWAIEVSSAAGALPA